MDTSPTVYPANETHAMFVPFAKLDPAQRMVYGYASTASLDSQGEIVEADAMREALGDYMQFPVVKEMHRMETAVGVTKSAEQMAKDSRDGTYVGVKVVDDAAWSKVVEGVYRGFSIGGKVMAKNGNKITKLKLREISLVDRPANPDAMFDVVKVADDAAPVVDVAPVADPAPVAVPSVSETKTPEVTPTMLKSDSIAPLSKCIYAAHMALEAMGDLVAARNAIEYDESQGGAEYAGMTEAINGAMAELATVLKDLLAAAMAAIVPGEGDDAGGDMMAMDKAVAEKLQKVRDAMSGAMAKIDGMFKVEAPAVVVVEPVAAPAAPAVEPAPAPAVEVVAKVEDANLAKIAGLESTIAELSAKVEAMGKIAAAPRTLRVVGRGDDLPDEIRVRANALAAKAEGEKDVRTIIKMVNNGLI